MSVSLPFASVALGRQTDHPSGDSLRALSRSLLALSDQAQHAQPQDMLRQALRTLSGLVAFDSAWWGEVSAGDVHTAPRNWLHGSIGLSQNFAEEWNALATVDEFAQQSMRRLGVVIRERDVMGEVPEHPQMIAFAQRHGLYHCMAITAELPRSGLMFFVSVYRPETRSEFTDEEAVLFGEFVVHLLQHWRHLLQRLQMDSPTRPWDSFALAEPSGALLFAGLRISMALSEACPGWTGACLPLEVAQALPRVPCSVTWANRAACGWSLVAPWWPSAWLRATTSPRWHRAK